LAVSRSKRTVQACGHCWTSVATPRYYGRLEEGASSDFRGPIMFPFLEAHSGELTILVLILMVLVTLIVIVPQLLRAHMRKAEMAHLEHMKALEHGQTLAVDDDRNRMAARLALLVPMVVMIAAGTVTCFVIMKGSEQVFT